MLYGQHFVRLFERIRDLGLTSSRHEFSLVWCGRGKDYVRDLGRRDGPVSQVSPRTVQRVRERLAEAATLADADLAAEIRALDAEIARDLYVVGLLGRRSYR